MRSEWEKEEIRDKMRRGAERTGREEGRGRGVEEGQRGEKVKKTQRERARERKLGREKVWR